jgi:F0F1-type ATP synthase membrane subunit b/b'
VQVALDRQSIVRRNFPIGDGGYDRGAVDAHLSALADEVEELKRSSGARGQSLAATASERIRAIVEGAETSAAEIERQAEEDAGRIRADAGNDAAAIRQQAKEHAHADVGKVSESTAGMLSRLEAMKGECNALFESLRTGSERLKSELDQLEGHIGHMREATGTPQPQRERPDAREQHAEPIAPQEHSALIAQGAVQAAAPQPPQTAAGDDAEGARLIALNMALNGTPREETDRYLAEHYRLNDRSGLLDEVYASVEG